MARKISFFPSFQKCFAALVLLRASDTLIAGDYLFQYIIQPVKCVKKPEILASY